MRADTTQILLVESESNRVERIRQAFDTADADQVCLTVAEDLRQAHNHLVTNPPHIVISGSLLPDGSASELLSTRTEDRSFPIVILGSQDRVSPVLMTGTVEYIVPTEITLAKMPQICRQVLQQWRQNSQPQENVQAKIESEHLLRLVSENTSTLIAYVDAQQRYRYVNQKYEQWFNPLRKPIIGKPVKEVLGSANYETVRPYLVEALANRAVSFETSFIINQAETRWRSADYIPDKNDDGEVQGVFILARDISEQRQAERQAAMRIQRLHKLSQLSMTLSGNPLEVFKHIAGLLAEVMEVPVVCLSEIRDETIYFLSVYNRGEILSDEGSCSLLNSPCKTVAQRRELQIIDQVRTKYPLASFLEQHQAVSYCGFPAFDCDGEVISITCLIDDKPHTYTEEDTHLLQIIAKRIGLEMERQKNAEQRKEAERESRVSRERMAHIARLSMLGEMATGLAHELNQPLTGIAVYASACQQLLETDSATRDNGLLEETLAKIETQSIRAGSIIHRLRKLVSKGEPEQRPFDLNEAVKDVVSLVESEARLNQVTIKLELEDGLPPAMGDEIQIEQVILNLLRNGIEAMIDEKIQQRDLTIRTTDSENRKIEVTVRDTGPGIPQQQLDKVFDSFVSTKPEGMGLGLAISRSIVQAQAGHLTVAPNPDCGVTFRLIMPTAMRKDRK